MQLPALGLAASLLLGPAPVDPGPAAVVEPDPAAVEAGPALPDVDDEAGAAEPTPEPTPEPSPESPAPTVHEPAAAPVEAPIEAPVETPVVDGRRDRLGCGGSKACTKMSVAGIVIGTLGLASVGTGIALVVQPDEVVPERPIYVTSTRPAGLVTLTLGAGVTLTAVLMLVAAHKGYKPRGDQARRVEPLANGLRF